MPHVEPNKQLWLGRVLDEHEELRRSLDEFRGFLSSPRPDVGATGCHTWASECATRLVELHEKLFRHFRFEEYEGMLHDLSEAHPRVIPQVEEIEREHPEMLESLRNIVGDVLVYSEGLPPEDSRIRRRITEVLDRLVSHEQREMDLIQHAFYRDIGAGD
ncbi:MAG TPA: hemerythrin domain-containing protein [Candidatus Krumholzibacteria bacterium]|jgi:hypothetical protein